MLHECCKSLDLLFCLGRKCTRMKGTIIALLLALLWPFFSFSQVKYEREYGVSLKEVPAPARAFAEKAFPGQKIKWFKEERLESASFEAKVAAFSVEFDTLGAIEDLEVLIKFSEIEGPARNSIETTLGKMFPKYKVQRAQIQWTGQEEALQALASGAQTALPLTIQYELVVKGKKAGLFELLFDESGNLLETLEIIPRNTDILDY